MSYEAEKLVPYANKKSSKANQVEEMFDEIAPKYDFLNHALSFGLDKGWRKKGIESLRSISPEKILDIATGTGDLAIMAYQKLHPKKIIAVDISEGMMDIGRKKVNDLGLANKIFFEWQDSTHLEIEDNSFDAAMVAFGVRNFENLDKGLQEIRRVLRPGGKLMILELSTPEYFPFKQGYQIYSKFIIPNIGRLISGKKSAYTYLPKSISIFPQNKALSNIMIKNGYSHVIYKKLTLGVCTLYLGTK
ncbi:bifunctional demethylmenaquinone methyltransferase/2-methoxy-6-polyprenyl-1,4-benzoquinol methylase UbiE [Bacteroidales bacterium OttesenSCG-928-M06]|nr:bifunctional demethylmenaquinone methyltransferase/2-methoxy-6-polyprenyl-1,4-benzoquinol methylase UbiE [Bacteroidales bacterium OttesenSCG-928-M06]